MSDALIYALVDPREPEHVRYIGMTAVGGDRSRPEYHRRYASPGNRCRTPLANWVRKLRREGVDYVVEVLDRMCPGTPRGCVGQREKAHIAYALRSGHRLMNATPGGEGGPTCQGKKWNEDQRARASQVQKMVSERIGRAQATAVRSRAMWAAKSDEERAAAGARLAESRKKGLRPFSQEHRERLSAVRREAHERGLYLNAKRDSGGRFSPR